MDDYCNYSFDDLYKAAFGKKLSTNQKKKLQKLPQEKINQLVEEWTQKAQWLSQEKILPQGTRFLAFSPPGVVQEDA